MINSSPNYRHLNGAATLIFTVILMVLSTLIILFAANVSRLEDSATANLTRNIQAFQAAEAGLEFGLNYLQKNNATILANPTAGFISPYSDSNTTNVLLTNNTKFTVVYTNPIANNFNLILVQSTGNSADGTATRVVKQQVQFGSLLSSSPTIPLTTKNNITLSNSAQITNTESNTTINTAKNVSINNSARTILSSGTSSTASDIQSDIILNDNALDALSSDDLFISYFGTSTNLLKNKVGYYYSNSANTNYSSALSGRTGSTIWIDQTSGIATINGFTTIGTPSNPNLIIINGNVNLGGIIFLYGILYIIGNLTTDSFNFININGAMIVVGSSSLLSNLQLTYNSSILSNLKSHSNLRYYAKVPGSWKDF